MHNYASQHAGLTGPRVHKPSLAVVRLPLMHLGLSSQVDLDDALWNLGFFLSASQCQVSLKIPSGDKSCACVGGSSVNIQS